MRKGQEPPAVRVLPADGSTPFESASPMQPGPGPRRSWPIPLAVVAAAVALFFVATLPSGDDAESETTPAASNSIDADAIDLTDTNSASMTTGWEEIPVETPAQIAGMIALNTSFIAYGSIDDRAATWLSGNGTRWNPVPAVDIPVAAPSRIDHAAVWNSHVVALGTVGDETGLWVAQTPSRWEYHGEIADMAGAELVGIAAGPELLAVRDRTGNGEMLGWVSADGLEWTSVGPLHGTAGLGVALTLAADSNGYYLGGEAACEEARCEPAIYHSANGKDWVAADLELPDPTDQQAGTVLDITSSPTGLVAVGVLGPFPSVQLAVWHSADGHEWIRLGEEEASFQQPSVGVALLSVTSGDTPSAVVSVGGERHQVTVASELATDVGGFSITEVAEDHLRFTHDSNIRRLGVGGTLNLTRTVQPWQVAAQGPRIVIAGALVGVNTRTPMFWSSVDGGHTWERTVASSEGIAIGAAVSGTNITAAISAGFGASSFWRSEWDTSSTESLAAEQLNAYVTAINERDIDTLGEILPADLRVSPRPSFQVPSLGDRKHSWWDQDRGTLRLDLVQQTLEYLDAIDATIDLTDCAANTRLGATDWLRVQCEFEATSDLTNELGATIEQGQLTAQFGDGRLREVGMSSPIAGTMWDRIASAAAGAPLADRSTILQVDPSGRAQVVPTFTADTASVHLRLARAFSEGLLRPGETKVVDTAFGTIEWKWLEELPVATRSFDWVSFVDGAFIATASRDDAPPYNISMWSSPDGLSWEEMAAPSDVDWMWNVTPFRGGLAADAWTRAPLSEGWGIGSPSILLFDGANWSSLPLPVEDDGSEVGLSRIAAKGEELLVLTQRWSEDEATRHEAWILGPDDAFRPAALPDEVRFAENLIGAVATDEGYIIGTSDFEQQMALWASATGETWDRLDNVAAPADVEFVWNLERHHNSLFVMGETDLNCSEQTGGGSSCEPTMGTWASSDGRVWERVLSTTGETVSIGEISSGPLGMVAIDQSYFSDQSRPKPVFISSDAKTWDRAGSLDFFDPDAGWWWVSRPAVGEKAVVMIGFASSDPVGPEQPFLIVGRIID